MILHTAVRTEIEDVSICAHCCTLFAPTVRRSPCRTPHSPRILKWIVKVKDRVLKCPGNVCKFDFRNRAGTLNIFAVATHMQIQHIAYAFVLVPPDGGGRVVELVNVTCCTCGGRGMKGSTGCHPTLLRLVV